MSLLFGAGQPLALLRADPKLLGVPANIEAFVGLVGLPLRIETAWTLKTVPGRTKIRARYNLPSIVRIGMPVCRSVSWRYYTPCRSIKQHTVHRKHAAILCAPAIG